MVGLVASTTVTASVSTRSSSACACTQKKEEHATDAVAPIRIFLQTFQFMISSTPDFTNYDDWSHRDFIYFSPIIHVLDFFVNYFFPLENEDRIYQNTALSIPPTKRKAIGSYYCFSTYHYVFCFITGRCSGMLPMMIFFSLSSQQK